MDQGFNDDELADIMNEIESLEKEFSDDTTTQPEAQQQEETQQTSQEVVEQPTAEVTETQTPTGHVAPEEQVEEVVEELANMPVENVEKAHANAHEDDNVHHLRQVEQPKHEVEQPVATQAPVSNNTQGSQTWPGHSSMNFSVKGNMTLDLNFDISGKSVNLSISETEFQIELEDGMKFSIPVNQGDKVKKAA